MNLSKGSYMKILYVEDSEVDHFIVNQILQESLDSFELKWVNNGLEAIETLKEENDFDIILLDINMPLMNGLEFLKAYQDGFSEHVDTFPLSSSKDKGDINTATSYSFVRAFLHKPLDGVGVNIISSHKI